MTKDVREFIRRLEAAGLTVESTPGHYHVLRDGKPLRKQNGMPFTLPFSPDTIRRRKAAIVELRKLGIHLSRGPNSDLGQGSPVTGPHVLSASATQRGHKTDTSETTRATSRDASPVRRTARFAGKTRRVRKLGRAGFPGKILSP
jgi:hypothetical protein